MDIYSDYWASCGVGCLDVTFCITNHDCFLWMEMEAVACLVDERGIWFGFGDIIAADDGLEIGGEVEVLEDRVGTG